MSKLFIWVTRLLKQSFALKTNKKQKNPQKSTKTKNSPTPQKSQNLIYAYNSLPNSIFVLVYFFLYE